MSNFIHRDSKLESVPTFLASRAVGFADSPEYRQMRDYNLTNPGVVASAFARYLQRLHKEQVECHMEASTKNAISSAHEALDFLASSHETDELVTDEIFESFDCSQDVLEHIRKSMLPGTRNLFDKWQARAS